MNILVLDLNATKCAMYHTNKHCISQLKESIQMLCSALIRHGQPVPDNSQGVPYKEAHPNHPCTKWVGDGLLNYQWLWDLAYALGEECEYRFGNTYYGFELLKSGRLPRDPKGFPTPASGTPRPAVVGDWIKEQALPVVDLYRMYYIIDKANLTSVELGDLNQHFSSAHKLGEQVWDDYSIWTKRGAPDFMGDRFYTSQCEYFGIKPAELMRMHREPDAPDSIALRQKMDRKIAKANGTVAPLKSRRRVKADELVDISDLLGCEPTTIKGLSNLTMPDLTKLRMVLPDADIPEDTKLPTGRLKKPFVDLCVSLFGEGIAFDKVTIPNLKVFLGLLGIS